MHFEGRYRLKGIARQPFVCWVDEIARDLKGVDFNYPVTLVPAGKALKVDRIPVPSVSLCILSQSLTDPRNLHATVQGMPCCGQGLTVKYEKVYTNQSLN